MAKNPRRISGVAKPSLTRREIDVLGLLAAGMSNLEIAGDLNIAGKTVNNHMNSILTKVDIPSWAVPRVYLALWYSKNSGRLNERPG